jgi:RNA polymerase sigma factor (sigma-70 family)
MTAADSSPPASRHPAIDWGRCLAEHQAWLQRVILARTGEPQAVDEVWQQLALAAVEQRWPLADPAKVAPWLHRLAVIAAARYCRQLGRQRRTIHQWAGIQAHSTSGDVLDPLALLMREERVALTRHALLSLPARDAEMLLLKYGERWSYLRIAVHLGISEKAVDCRLMRARAHLRRMLANLGVEDCEP